MTLTGQQESGKASWKRGQPWSQVVNDFEGVGASSFSRVSPCSAWSRGEEGDLLKRRRCQVAQTLSLRPSGKSRDSSTLRLLVENWGSSHPRVSMLRGPAGLGQV